MKNDHWRRVLSDTGAKPFLKAKLKAFCFGITEIELLTPLDIYSHCD